MNPNDPDSELDKILVCNCGVGNLPEGKHYDDCPKHAKQAILAWHSRLVSGARIDQTKHLQAAEARFGKVEWQAALYELEDRTKYSAPTPPPTNREGE